jgi:hypothetical protein
MKEEQAVLDFFARQENLPLALTVAEQVDFLRRRTNNDFWRELAKRAAVAAPAWQVQLTEDRNAEDYLVGLHLQPVPGQALFLRPMLEQQTIGDTPRIYFGLMWSDQAGPDRLILPEVATLQETLRREGFRNNEKFLAWQWSPYHPRSKHFLLRFSTGAEALLDEVNGLLKQLLIAHGPLLAAANTALRNTSRSTVISTGSLRDSLRHQ